jgi:hypothetical protein
LSKLGIPAPLHLEVRFSKSGSSQNFPIQSDENSSIVVPQPLPENITGSNGETAVLGTAIAGGVLLVVVIVAVTKHMCTSSYIGDLKSLNRRKIKDDFEARLHGTTLEPPVDEGKTQPVVFFHRKTEFSSSSTEKCSVEFEEGLDSMTLPQFVQQNKGFALPEQSNAVHEPPVDSDFCSFGMTPVGTGTAMRYKYKYYLETLSWQAAARVDNLSKNSAEEPAAGVGSADATQMGTLVTHKALGPLLSLQTEGVDSLAASNLLEISPRKTGVLPAAEPVAISASSLPNDYVSTKKTNSDVSWSFLVGRKGKFPGADRKHQTAPADSNCMMPLPNALHKSDFISTQTSWASPTAIENSKESPKPPSLKFPGCESSISAELCCMTTRYRSAQCELPAESKDLSPWVGYTRAALADTLISTCHLQQSVESLGHSDVKLTTPDAEITEASMPPRMLWASELLGELQPPPQPISVSPVCIAVDSIQNCVDIKPQEQSVSSKSPVGLSGEASRSRSTWHLSSVLVAELGWAEGGSHWQSANRNIPFSHSKLEWKARDSKF